MPKLTQTSIEYRRKASQIRELLDRTADEATQLKLISQALEWITLAEAEEAAVSKTREQSSTCLILPMVGKRSVDD